mmetsp:Transcript_44500/g.71297  ORF Transcript_44500/g.71297 Transcript_44500/m.71297 type:complete len:106 (-) Transcript_44500:895-1212(-)
MKCIAGQSFVLFVGVLFSSIGQSEADDGVQILRKDRIRHIAFLELATYIYNNKVNRSSSPPAGFEVIGSGDRWALLNYTPAKQVVSNEKVLLNFIEADSYCVFRY